MAVKTTVIFDFRFKCLFGLLMFFLLLLFLNGERLVAETIADKYCSKNHKQFLC